MNKLLSLNGGPGSLSRTCTPITAYFHDKTKFLKKIFEWIIIYCQNIAVGYMPQKWNRSGFSRPDR